MHKWHKCTHIIHTGRRVRKVIFCFPNKIMRMPSKWCVFFSLYRSVRFLGENGNRSPPRNYIKCGKLDRFIFNDDFRHSNDHPNMTIGPECSNETQNYTRWNHRFIWQNNERKFIIIWEVWLEYSKATTNYSVSSINCTRFFYCWQFASH